MIKFFKIITKFWKYVKAVYNYIDEYINIKELAKIKLIVQALESKELPSKTKDTIAFNTLKKVFNFKDLAINLGIQLIKVFIKARIIKANPDKQFNIIEDFILNNIDEIENEADIKDKIYKKLKTLKIKISISDLDKYYNLFLEFKKYFVAEKEKTNDNS
jgi:hypothetical protein